MIPDGEKVIGNYLRTALTPLRVVGRTPDDKTQPWVRLTLLDAANDPAMTPDWLITYMLQCDCYASAAGIDGSQQKEAAGLGGTVRHVLDAAKGSILGGSAVVTNVRFTNMARVPDDDGFEPARERIVLDAEVTMHRAGTI